MAESGGDSIHKACENFSKNLKFPVEIKPEQLQAVEALLKGSDVLAVLPTGYGKSFIFQVFAAAAAIERKQHQTVLVVCPLLSIIEDQVAEARSIGMSAASVADLSLEELRSAKFQLLFGSAEKVIDKHFLDALRDNGSRLHVNLAAVVVDESHTVEMWTGKRSDGNKNGAAAFREAFGKLSTLRSFCKQGTPVLALTGTADCQTQSVIVKQLELKQVKKFFVSPNRGNLRISIIKCKKEEMFKNLAWLVDLLKEKGTAMPKSILFCNGTLTDIAVVLNYLLFQLGKAAYSPSDSQTSDNCLFGIYHSLTLKKYKQRIMESFKANGKKRIVIASSALSMGVNFPDIRYIIHWGPARNLLDYHQESGRGGRDGKPTQVLTIYYGQQTSFCEEDVKAFLNTKDCMRVQAYMPFDKRITSAKPAHGCCKNCARNCRCSGGGCSVSPPIFELENVVRVHQSILTRPICPNDKEDLCEALHEVIKGIIPTMNFLSEEVDSNYAEHVVDAIVENAHSIFTVMDITEHIPVFAVQHALKILEVFNEIFEDIPNLDMMVELFGKEKPFSSLPEQPVEYLFEQSGSDSSVDNEEEFL